MIGTEFSALKIGNLALNIGKQSKTQPIQGGPASQTENIEIIGKTIKELNTSLTSRSCNMK